MSKKIVRKISLLMALTIMLTTLFFGNALVSKSLASEAVNISSIEGVKNIPLYIKDSRLGSINGNTKVTFKNEDGTIREFNSSFDEDLGLYYLELNFDTSGHWKLVNENIPSNINAEDFSVNIYENLNEMTGFSGGYVSTENLENNSSIIGEKLEDLISKLIGYDSTGNYTDVKLSFSGQANATINVFNNGMSSSITVPENTNLPAGRYNVKVQAGSFIKDVTINLLSDYSNIEDLENIESVSTLSGESSLSATVSADRLSGISRYETAVAISKNQFSSSKYVVLANGQAPNDILVASSLAGNLNAPILITDRNSLNASTKAEIQRLNSSNIIVIGGNSKISSAVTNSLKSMGKNVEVINGSSDADMSVKVANKAMEFKSANTVILSSEKGLPDSLSASALAAKNGYPIIYTGKNAISGVAKGFIKNGKISNVIIVGGDQTISNGVLNSVKSMGKSVSRVYGRSRYDTSLAIAKNYFNNSSTVGLATGAEFVDSLTSGPVSGLNNQAILLVSNNTLSSGIKDYIKSTGAKSVYLYGGTSWLSEGFRGEVLKYLNQIHNISQTQNVATKPRPTKPRSGKVRILLDPGHGAGSRHNRGYVGPKWKNEGDGNYYYSLLLAKELRAYGIEVGTTRDNIYKDPSLQARGQMARGYDLFISLHTNAFKGQTSGVEIYEDVNDGAPALTAALSRTISETLDIPNRGVKHRYYGDNDSGVNPKANYYGVLRANGATAGMLIEHCYHDYESDVLKYEARAEQLAKNMARTIAKYYGLI
ncbi:cell wall-binding repeat-containing protein [Lagierella sp. ICN-221743]